MTTEVHHDDGRPAHLTTDEARAGTTPHMARYALGWGMALVVIAFVVVLLYYMLNS
jgi:hypothetical protein